MKRQTTTNTYLKVPCDCRGPQPSPFRLTNGSAKVIYLAALKWILWLFPWGRVAGMISNRFIAEMTQGENQSYREGMDLFDCPLSPLARLYLEQISNLSGNHRDDKHYTD